MVVNGSGKAKGSHHLFEKAKVGGRRETEEAAMMITLIILITLINPLIIFLENQLFFTASKL